MALKEKITEDMKTAMKAKDTVALTVLRGLLSTISNRAIEKRTKTGKDEPLTDEEILGALMSEAKKRKESIVVFSQNKRDDLAGNEKTELTVIEKYLPAQLSADEVALAVEKIFAGAPVKEFGPVMKLVMAELRGKADAGVVTDLIKKKLG